MFLLFLLFLLGMSSICPQGFRTHTIYISGPPLKEYKSWYKKSKYLYRGLKKEIESEGNTIELFPKKSYRKSLLKKRKLNHSLSKKSLGRRYEEKNELLKELIELILKRHKEIKELNLEDKIWDERIHLQAHGKGSRLLHKLKESTYSKLLGVLISFDGVKNKSKPSKVFSYSEGNYLSGLSSDSELDSSELYIKKSINIYMKKAVRLGISEKNLCKLINRVREKNSVLNITIDDIDNDEIWKIKSGCKSCNTKKALGTIGALLGVIAGIMALL